MRKCGRGQLLLRVDAKGALGAPDVVAFVAALQRAVVVQGQLADRRLRVGVGLEDADAAVHDQVVVDMAPGTAVHKEGTARCLVHDVGRAVRDALEVVVNCFQRLLVNINLARGGRQVSLTVNPAATMKSWDL